MLILEAGNIKKYYGDRLVFSFKEFKVFSGDRIGVVGENGAGKTTFLNILSKNIVADEGYVKQFCNISYIEQMGNFNKCVDAKLSKEFGVSYINSENCSGGEKTRMKLANAFSTDNLLIFADEPTTNLDYKGIELLKSKLFVIESLLLISHDRSLLDSVCNKILEIKDGQIKLFSGNYTFYKEQLELEKKTQQTEYERFITEKVKLESAIEERKGKAKSIRKAPKRMGNSEARLHTRKSNETQEKVNNAVNSLKTRLEKLEIKQRPKEMPAIKLDFSLTNPPQNRVVISGERLCFGYRDRIIFSNAEFKVLNNKKTALWGENGTGKTTLLDLISKNTNDCIKIAPKAKIGYFHQEMEILDSSKSIIENAMKDSVQTQTVVRTILARLLFKGEDVHKKVGVLSGGERVKVSFAKLFVSDANILLLDEPTNFLDMTSLELLQEVLGEYEGTVLFVSHDSAFVNAIADRMLIIENMKIKEFDGNLNDYMYSKDLGQNRKAKHEHRIVLEVRLSQLIAALSQPNTDKASLEVEYQKLLSELNAIKQGDK